MISVFVHTNWQSHNPLLRICVFRFLSTADWSNQTIMECFWRLIQFDLWFYEKKVKLFWRPQFFEKFLHFCFYFLFSLLFSMTANTPCIWYAYCRRKQKFTAMPHSYWLIIISKKDYFICLQACAHSVVVFLFNFKLLHGYLYADCSIIAFV